MFRADFSKRLMRSFVADTITAAAHNNTPTVAATSTAATAAVSSLSSTFRSTHTMARVPAARIEPLGLSSECEFSANDIKDSAKKLWVSLRASRESLLSPITGEAGTARITHNLTHGENQWQASCVEVRCRSDVNPVISQRRQAFRNSSGKLPWEKKGATEDDDVEVVFYFETHTKSGLDGYQHTAERVAAGELPGECSNTTGIGGFATWCVPRRDFLAMLQERPMLEGDSLFGSGGHNTDADDHSSRNSSATTRNNKPVIDIQM